MNHALIFNIHFMPYNRPAGPYRIASFLREEGWDVEVIEYATFWSLDELKELARSRVNNDTIFIGFSTFFSSWNDSIEDFTKWLKEKYPNINLILGTQSKPRVEANYIDYFVTGYGEHAILALCKSFVSNSEIILDSRYDKKVVSANVNYQAFPMKSLMIKYEDRDYIKPTEWLNLEISRGCKFKCLFCNFPVLGVRGDYTRDADDLYIQLMDTYDRFGITNYYITDETFNDSTYKLEKFAKVIDKIPFDPWFTAFIRADILEARRGDWELLLRLGILGHFYGVESFNPETTKAIGKGNPDKVKEGILEARKYFKTHGRQLYRGAISLIAGLPYETKQSLTDTFHWLKNNWQGESFIAWALEIPLTYQEDILSRLSLDYPKYGYKISNVDTSSSPMSDHTVSKINWENDEWTYNECKDFLAELQKDTLGDSDFRLDPFLINGYLPINELLDLTSSPETFDRIGDMFINQRNTVIKEYIHKKLSL